MSTVFYHRPGHAAVHFEGKLTWSAALELVDTLHTVVDTFFYRAVELVITSPGGDTDALWHVLNALRERQSQGVLIHTRVVSYAASAAAVLACSGTLRSAAPHAKLLFHAVRVHGGEALTAESARTVLAQASDLDRSILDQLTMSALITGALPAPEPSALAADRRMLERLWPVAAPRGRRARRPRSLSTLTAVVGAYVERAVAARDEAALRRLYRRLLPLDAVISPGLAHTLRLIDCVGAGPDLSPPPDQVVGLTVPEWSHLYPPDGTVPRDVLARHMLVLGETGSGKTISAVLPLLAALARSDGLDAALVVDPKGELGPVLEVLAPERLRHLVPGRFALNMMAGARWSLEDDLAAGRWLTAAHRILLRSASFAPMSAARVLLPHESSGDPSAEFFDREGTSLCQCVLALVLLLLARGADADAQLCDASSASAAFGVRGGGSMPVVFLYPEDDDPSESRDVGIARWLRRFRARAAGGLSALALTHWALTSPLVTERPRGRWLCSYLAEALVAASDDDMVCEAQELRERIVTYWGPMHHAERQFAGVLSSAVNACVDFAAPGAARALYVGCEPGHCGDAQGIDFAAAVSPRAGPGPLLLFQPARDARDHLVALVLKAMLFEAVLDDPDRSRGGHDLPLVAYVADEAHRFLTSDLMHGEQSFCDSSRSYGAVCVLATQSLASVAHALAHGASRTAANDAALSMLWNNCSTKIVFRSGDADTAQRLAGLCPKQPGQLPVVDVRPLSTLACGECYAAVADGRFERRQLEPFAGVGPERAQERDRLLPIPAISMRAAAYDEEEIER